MSYSSVPDSTGLSSFV